MANKVKWGLENVYYAKATIDPTNNTATYGTPVKWPGAVSLNMEPQGEQTPFRADNIDYWIGNANNGYEGDFESALIPDSFKKDILGMVEDNKGVLIEVADAEAEHFALLFQFEGDANKTRHVLYNVTCGRPSIAGETTGETLEPQTETASFRAISIHNSALDTNLVKASVAESTESGSPYGTWFESVYQPAALPSA